jgi:CHAT domain-containing protein
VLDDKTRKFPWELAFDGQDFLCGRYDLSRKIKEPHWERLSGSLPETNRALVIGLNYRWKKKDDWLYRPEREALSISKLLSKNKKFKVTLLRSKATKRENQATLDNVKVALSEGVSIFHFSGHGAYRSKMPNGKKGSLVLRDGDLTEDDLRDCFKKAKGAPYLSFLNACQSAKEIYSSHFVDAFVQYGAEFVVGTFWSVLDTPSTDLARRFYREITDGTSVAHALTLARNQIIRHRKTDEIATWPSFVLYGSSVYGLPAAQ